MIVGDERQCMPDDRTLRQPRSGHVSVLAIAEPIAFVGQRRAVPDAAPVFLVRSERRGGGIRPPTARLGGVTVDPARDRPQGRSNRHVMRRRGDRTQVRIGRQCAVNGWLPAAWSVRGGAPGCAMDRMASATMGAAVLQGL
jgi:hypothetical protein